MTQNNESNTTSEASTESVKHEITAYEAHWRKTKFRHDPDSVTAVEITYEETQEAVENTIFHWEYYCRCGEEFIDYEAAKKHLLDHSNSS